MPAPEFEMLGRVVSQLVGRTTLTHDERREVLHVARGLATPEAAEIERVPVAVIRARRKALYRKLRVTGSNALLSRLLALSLARLAGRKGRDAGGRRVRARRGTEG